MKKTFIKPKITVKRVPINLLFSGHGFDFSSELFAREVYAQSSSIYLPYISKSGGIGGRCFTAGTLISHLDKTTTPIEKIQLGDIVLSYDVIKHTFIEGVVTDIESHTRDDGYYLLNKSLKVTHDHPLWNIEAWKTVEKIEVGDKLFQATDNVISVTSKEYIAETIIVYNIQVDKGTKPYFAQSILANSYK